MASAFDATMDAIAQTFLKDFKKTTRYFALFHLLFGAVALLELLIFLLFFSFFTQSALFAISLAVLLLTGFAYFVLRFYFQMVKPEEMQTLCVRYFDEISRGSATYGDREQRCATAVKAAYLLVDKLKKLEHTYYRLPIQLPSLHAIVEKFSIWSHWKDVHTMVEMLLYKAIERQIESVKTRPTDPNIHWDLAQSYTALARLYLPPDVSPGNSPPWISPEFFSTAMLQKLERAARFAIEEYRIVEHYTPNNLEVYRQLATLYGLTRSSHEEMAICDKMLSLLPNEESVLLRLGTLCFEQGLYARGLSIYEKLLHIETPKAQELIRFYDARLKTESAPLSAKS